MTAIHRFQAGVLACALLVTGCGDSKKTPSAGESGGNAGSPVVHAAQAPPPPAAMFDLLPEGTVGVLYVPSLDKLEAGAKRLVATGSEKKADSLKIADLAAMQGLDAADLDMTRAAAVAMTLSKDAPEPGITAIVPVRDDKTIGAKVKAQNPRASVDAASGFAAVTPAGPYKRGGIPARLAGPIPSGDVVVRLDAATLAKAFGPMLFEKMGETLEAVPTAPGAANPAATLKPMLEGMKAVLDAASILDIALRIDGTAIEVEVTVTFADGAKVPVMDMFAKADLATLARSLPDEGMISMAASVDGARMWSAMSGFMKASLEAYPPAARATLQKMFDSAEGIMKLVGHGMAATGGFTASGMEFVYAIETPDAAAFAKSVTGVLSALDLKDSFMTFSPPAERTVDGTKVTAFKLQIDAEKLPDMEAAGMKPGANREMLTAMFGRDGISYSIADFGNRVMAVLGGDDVLKRAIKAAKAADTGSLSKALVAAGPDTVCFMRMDFRAVMRWASGLMKSAGGENGPKIDVAAGDPVVITMVANAGSNRLRGRLSLDVGQMVKLFKAAMPK